MSTRSDPWSAGRAARLAGILALQAPGETLAKLIDVLDALPPGGRLLGGTLAVVCHHQPSALPGGLGDRLGPRALGLSGKGSMELGDQVGELGITSPRHGQDVVHGQALLAPQRLQGLDVVETQQAAVGDHHHQYPKLHSATESEYALERVLARAARLTTAPLLVRMDAGFDAGKLFAAIDAASRARQGAGGAPIEALVKWNPRGGGAEAVVEAAGGEPPALPAPYGA